MENDAVNHPVHYTSGDIECIDAISDKGKHEGNCIKYLWRYEQKGGREDILKCEFYLKALIKADTGR